MIRSNDKTMGRDNRLIVATANIGKFREVCEIFADLPFHLISMNDYFESPPNIEENGSTFLENARIKADWVYRQSLLPTLADDSGLVVDALDGAPGVRSARYAGENADTEANNNKLLKQLQGVTAEKRTARFVCSVVLRVDDTTVFCSEGCCEGRIIEKPRGSGGFGYDPLFIPDGYDRTFAELTSEEKHLISHRGKALKSLREQLYGYFT